MDRIEAYTRRWWRRLVSDGFELKPLTEVGRLNGYIPAGLCVSDYDDEDMKVFFSSEIVDHIRLDMEDEAYAMRELAIHELLHGVRGIEKTSVHDAGWRDLARIANSYYGVMVGEFLSPKADSGIRPAIVRSGRYHWDVCCPQCGQAHYYYVRKDAHAVQHPERFSCPHCGHDLDVIDLRAEAAKGA